ncbi:MAG TPA: polysaccharide ABC transporter ATP-binding protein, partial [Bacteroidia bacterium]|nr:polysaccharide ABC transporter ATP-binding protein [Bacteroidia bacterium]
NQSASEEFYALQDINFNVEQGACIGLIGRNGSGKSTLLKILSRITLPTTGSIISRGRMASLLEVGTGFHAELSGRENIFLNGSILGMTRKEILAKFDEIIDFSGTEKFLDTPLKFYSSGMSLRLAFSVAAFLEPEIMVIDEVLAVGDAEFQKKCMGKMEDINKDGRTILFVSHDLNAVQTLCRSAILLNAGKILMTGESEKVISHYLHSGNLATTTWVQKAEIKHPHFEKIDVKIEGKQPNSKLVVHASVKCKEEMAPSFISFDIFSKLGAAVGQAIPNTDPFIKPANGSITLTTEIDLNGLIPGDYFLDAWMGSSYGETYDSQRECIEFSIVTGPQTNVPFPHNPHHCFIVLNSRLV